MIPHSLDTPDSNRLPHRPWAERETDEHRLDVHNGLLLSALWDGAFDAGLVSFADDGAVLVSPRLAPALGMALGVDRTENKRPAGLNQPVGLSPQALTLSSAWVDGSRWQSHARTSASYRGIRQKQSCFICTSPMRHIADRGCEHGCAIHARADAVRAITQGACRCVSTTLTRCTSSSRIGCR